MCDSLKAIICGHTRKPRSKQHSRSGQQSLNMATLLYEFRVTAPTTPGYMLPIHHDPLPAGFKRGMVPMPVAVSPTHEHAGKHFGEAGPEHAHGLASKWTLTQIAVNGLINQIRNNANTIWKVTNFPPVATARAIFNFPVGVIYSGGAVIPCTGVRLVIYCHQDQPGHLITAYPVVAEGM